MAKSIHVTIYCDESKDRKVLNSDFEDPQNWKYIGVCIVPTENIDKVANKLNDMRCGAEDCQKYMSCTRKCDFHDKNKRKIHFTELQNGYIFKTADKWINLINENYLDKNFYMSILGIDYNKLDKTYFKTDGEKTNVDNNIYCRFFRTIILYSLKFHFKEYDYVYVDNIYHDIGDMEYHEFFKRQVINYTKWHENKISILCNQITFLKTDSSNCLNNNQVFLQLIDLFLGAAINLIHADAKSGNKKYISLKLYKIVNYCLHEYGNVNSRYHRLYSISFFPKNKITDSMNDIDILLNRRNNFFHNRKIKLSNNEQISLF